ncbi:DUF2515 domain-containing protein [Metabacillus litoralis]|nr:DUF2515 domain-containing protein [Metabacillus litoralis]MCM3163062.1 DUF2515 domain-containing protein [Metabacillus litoralis]UHA58146.1 DUF2515 domain-containing protein [Metabacillus litoralis]
MFNKSKTNNINMDLDEQKLVSEILQITKTKNIDNISRTKAYEEFYFKHPEIKWSFLASMVSRNAGWSMTDLQGRWFRKALNQEKRSLLFMTYERANWTIFYDAFPQLLIYQLSKKINKPLFHLLSHFQVSKFMEKEWWLFWEERQKDRLMTALIINEQNVIHHPVIMNETYRRLVFKSASYKFQDLFHFSTVIFPTLHGKLFGFSVYNFEKLTNRIELGKRLGWLLFDSGMYQHFVNFARTVPHTGSRYDYEKYFADKRKRETPLLRTAYPIIPHTLDGFRKDWFHGQNTKHLFKRRKIPKNYEITDWFKHKQDQLHLFTVLQEYWRNG